MMNRLLLLVSTSNQVTVGSKHIHLIGWSGGHGNCFTTGWFPALLRRRMMKPGTRVKNIIILYLISDKDGCL